MSDFFSGITLVLVALILLVNSPVFARKKLSRKHSRNKRRKR